MGRILFLFLFFAINLKNLASRKDNRFSEIDNTKQREIFFLVILGNQTEMRGVRKQGNYTNPCLTMHQPWASLLVYGIKRIEGRSWPAPLRGRLWIHAASKIPEEATIKAMEEFYREIYAVNGITDLNFPQHYPVSRLLGCVEVVGCVRCEELASWEVLPEGVRLEGQTDFCWLCENPQKLLVPFEMRGYQGVYNLEKKVYEAAVRGLIPVKVPLPVKFPLPNSQDPFSLKPGSLSVYFPENKSTTLEKSSTLNAAIAGAREAASQFHKKNQDLHTNVMQNEKPYSLRSRSENNSSGGDAFKHGTSALAEDGERNLIEHEESSSQDQPRRHLKRDLGALKQGTSALAEDGERNLIEHEESSSHDQPLGLLKRDLGAPSRIFAAAVRGLKPS